MPNFIGIGSGKCGTTWIYQMLKDHPDIYSGHPKEINFFNSDYPYYDFGIEWYENHFKGATGLCTGEFSVSYLYDLQAMERIIANYPKAKILIAIRDPIDRAISDYYHDIRKGNITPKTEFIRYFEQTYNFEHGLYCKHIDNVKKIFPIENILIIPSSFIAEKPELLVRRLYNFIGVNDQFQSAKIYEKSNQGFMPRFVFLENMIAKTSAYLTKIGCVNFLECIKKFKVHELVRKYNSKSISKPHISQTAREKLEKLYDKEIQLIKDLELDWSNWENGKIDS
jgi:hypothetical protein